jgi:hypothetical protein
MHTLNEAKVGVQIPTGTCVGTLSRSSLFGIIKHYDMKTCGGLYLWDHIYLTSVLVVGEWSASRSIRCFLK